VYHDYCLNYAKAMTYLEQLRKNEEFCEFEKVKFWLVNLSEFAIRFAINQSINQSINALLFTEDNMKTETKDEDKHTAGVAQSQSLYNQWSKSWTTIPSNKHTRASGVTYSMSIGYQWDCEGVV